MEATPLERRLRLLQMSRYTLNGNYAQLFDAEEHLRENAETWVRQDPEVSNEFLLEYSRRLHNYLSSYYSLYSHTLRIRNHVDSEDFNETYDRKIEDMDLERTSNFVKRFRSYIQHYQLLPITIHSSHDFETKVGSAELYVSRKRLLKWNGWDGSRDYVLELDEEIEIVPLLEDIHDSVNEFGDWFIDELQSRSDVRDAMLEDYADLIDVDEPYSLS